MERVLHRQDTYKGSPWQPWTQNLYTYVGNNPINYVDPTGHCPWCVGAAVGAVFNTAGYVAGQLLTGSKITVAGVATAAVAGAISGALGGVMANPAAYAVASGVVNGLQTLVTDALDGNIDFSARGLAEEAGKVALSAGAGALSGKFGGLMTDEVKDAIKLGGMFMEAVDDDLVYEAGRQLTQKAFNSTALSTIEGDLITTAASAFETWGQEWLDSEYPY